MDVYARHVGELLARVWENLAGRVHGPLAFRLIVQPTIAVLLAVRAGLRDARAGHPAYAWAIVADPLRRRELLRETWQDVAKVFVMALIVDSIYEVIVFHRLYPGESVVVASILALLPYLLLRGPINRITRGLYHEAGPKEGHAHPRA